MFLQKTTGFFRKTLLLLFLTGTMPLYAQGQTITLSERTISAGEVIKSIERQTDYQVSYNRNTYDTTRVLTLPRLAVPLGELLDNIVEGEGVKYMIQGRYIALVPTNDNSRPQVRQQPQPPRTSDVYSPSSPNSLSAAPIEKPAPAPVAGEPQPVAPPEPEKELYSDYRPIDIYGDVQSSLPRFALKVNLLYGLATLTPNISAEVALSRRSTLGLSYSNNPWKYDADMGNNKKLLHGIVSLEYRYWFCERYSGHFFGVHGFYSEYNVSEYNIPTFFEKEYRYKGNAYGGGLTYGYALPIGRMWNLEFTAGLDVLRMDYDRYGCTTCDRNSVPFKKTKVTPMAGINLVFLIK